MTTSAPATATIRVLVADDHDLVCAGIERAIAAEGDMEVCASASTGEQALALAIAHRPDVLVLDVHMAGMGGLACTREVRKAVPECEVMLFTGTETDELMREAFLCGAKSLILKSDAREHLVAAIRMLARHRAYFTSKVSEVIFSRLLNRRASGSDGGRLTARDLEIVRRLARGESNKELARHMGVNLRTAEGHRAMLMKKMGFASLADLVRYAVRNGIVEC